MIQYLANSLGTSAARMPCRGTDPNKKRFERSYFRRILQQIFETVSEVTTLSTEKKLWLTLALASSKNGFGQATIFTEKNLYRGHLNIPN